MEEKKRKDRRGGRRVPGPGKSLGRPPVEHPKVMRHTLLLRDPLWDWIEAQAAAGGVTVNQFIEKVLSRARANQRKHERSFVQIESERD